MSEPKRVISRKKINVQKELPRWRRPDGRNYTATHPEIGGTAFGFTAEGAREELVRLMVMKGWVDPRPAARGGAR